MFLFIKKFLPESVRIKIRPLAVWFTTWSFKTPAVVSVNDGGVQFAINVDPKNGAVDSYIKTHKKWDTQVAGAIHDVVTPDMQVLDVGANIGYFTLLLAKRVGKDGAVFAFEPIASVASQLQASVALNNLTNVTVFQKAIGSEFKQTTIYKTEHNIGASSQIPKTDHTEAETINVVRLSEVIDTDVQIDFIKIDVEGFELDALLGMQECIENHAPIILLEFSPNTYNAIDPTITIQLLEFLQTHNYTIYDLDHTCAVDDIGTYLTLLNNRQANLLCRVT